MTEFAFPPPAAPSVAVAASSERFPVHRIYCVGRNYADHVHEMGADPQSEPPVFFTKPADAVVANGAAVPYPPRTANFHHEIELVAAIGRGGRDIREPRALRSSGASRGMLPRALTGRRRLPRSARLPWGRCRGGASGSVSTASCARSRT